MTRLPIPSQGRDSAEAFVSDHLSALVSDVVRGSQRFRGGQSQAEAILDRFDVEGYAAGRNEVYPQPRRASSALSPYIRHGLLSLQRVWDRVEGGPSADVAKFRNELLWQEYARHWYARLGARTSSGTRHRLPPPVADHLEWDRRLACLELSVGELEDDGWLVNQSRMWLASHWAVRSGARWQDGEDYFFRHLLDGSRAANRLGWQWTSGVGAAKSYGFSRWQVEERAPGLCASCDLVHACPIEDWPNEPELLPTEQPVDLRSDRLETLRRGPEEPTLVEAPELVWLTAESLGRDDPALAAHPDLSVVFVFDQPLLARLQLSSKRLVFLVETLAELAESRELELHVGQPVEVLGGRKTAVTFAPVPGFGTRAEQIRPVAVHPWPWLRRPNPGSVLSFSSWLKAHD